ncbi:hypothetical protein N7517_010341 [Penicillium concentricum]|uniref:Uncharacterized protein n=1 Tax=Penicillium concentricum TaxID=293559 RepID=A0A9W9R8R5_9EURO|nr:uncharacterized protein N7517_010341 [Penicillium concentricum]KAJ5355732.1 hypothetical protein N7517_010341 [Penicillium concentricum]
MSKDTLSQTKNSFVPDLCAGVSDNWKKQCEDTQGYYAPVFSGRIEKVAQTVTGYLLAWRIALGPGVGCVQYSSRSTK